jgi:hypothetical protein
MYGIMGLKKGGKGKGRHGAHAKYVAGPSAYKTGSRKGTAAGDKGDKKSQAKTARELDQMILSGDVTRGGEDFLSGKISAAERRQQLLDLAKRGQGKGIPFALDPEEFTGNLRGLSNAAKIGKLRGDMSPSDYHNYMRALHGANPAAMEKAFPWGSGAALRGLANLAVPAPLKMLGAMAGDLGTAAKQGLGYLGPEGMKRDLTPGLQKAWGDIKDAPSGFARDAKALLTGKLSPIETANLGIIKDEQQDEQNPLGNLIEGDQSLEDTHDAILEDLLGMDEGAATETVDASQNIAYDPTRPINYASEASGVPTPLWNHQAGDELDNLLIENELDELLGQSENDQFYKDNWGVTEEEYHKIMDPSPLTREQVDKGLWSQAESYDDKWLEDALGYPVYKSMSGRFFKVNPETGYVQMDEDITDDVTKLSMSTRTDRPTAGQFNLSGQEDIFDVGGNQNQIDEVREQIETEVYPGAPRIDWGFNQGGYLKKYDDGGYANMSTFEKLKAINDSIAEG